MVSVFLSERSPINTTGLQPLLAQPFIRRHIGIPLLLGPVDFPHTGTTASGRVSSHADPGNLAPKAAFNIQRGVHFCVFHNRNNLPSCVSYSM
jgi:hypothetical protein